jgi:hypothetical protein
VWYLIAALGGMAGGLAIAYVLVSVWLARGFRF